MEIAMHIPMSDITIPLPGLCPVDLLTQVSDKAVTQFVITNKWEQPKCTRIWVCLKKFNRVPCNSSKESGSSLYTGIFWYRESWYILFPLAIKKVRTNLAIVFTGHEVGGEGDQKMSHENMPLWHKGYFELKATEKKLTQEEFFALPISA